MAQKFTLRATVATMLAMMLAIVQAQAGLITQSQELQMGRDAARQIESQYRVSTDQRANALVSSIGSSIARMSSRPNLAWQFVVLETADVNASSVPAYVFVNRGLLSFVGNDRDALAGVIAHEVGHTAGRHAVKAAEQQLKLGLALSLLMKGNTGQQLGNLAANLARLGYGRKEEYQADKLGVDYMSRAKYDPNGMLRFFRKLQQKEGSSGSGGLSLYFRTHPPTLERITRVRNEMTALGYRPRY